MDKEGQEKGEEKKWQPFSIRRNVYIELIFARTVHSSIHEHTSRPGINNDLFIIVRIPSVSPLCLACDTNKTLCFRVKHAPICTHVSAHPSIQRKKWQNK